MNIRVSACTILGMVGIAASAAVVGDVTPNTTTVRKYEKLEIRFAIDREYENPYDPSVVAVDALIDGRAGTIEYPCFFRGPADVLDHRKVVDGPGIWMLRFAFREEGNYTIRFRVRDGEESVTGPVKITVQGTHGKGFIGISPGDPQTFAFDDGTPFNPVGYNAAWQWGDHYLSSYTSWLRKMHANGVRLFRYWFIGFAGQELEWTRGKGANMGLGRYHQGVAATFDSVVAVAERKGIAIMPVFETHGEWSTKVNPNWNTNPYNKANGGILDSPAQYFTDIGAIQLAKNRYRYIIARWGYSPAIFAWEFYNEVQFADIWHEAKDSVATAAWHEEMARYFRHVDLSGKHLLTTSAPDGGLGDAIRDRAPSLDFVQHHHYAPHIHRIVQSTSAMLLDNWEQPSMCGEFGPGIKPESYDNDGYREGDQIRKTDWLSMMSKASSLYWWWGHLIREDLYHVYKPLSAFTEGVDMSGLERIDLLAENGPNPACVDLPPVLGWEASRQQEFTMDRFGVAPGIGLLSRYLHGTWKSQLGTWCEFSVNYAVDGEARMSVSEVSQAGGNRIVVFVDRDLVADRAFEGKGVLSVPVRRGEHRIRFENKGLDWVDVSEYTFCGAASPCVKGVGLRSDSMVMGYLYDGRNPVAIPEKDAPQVVNVVVPLPELRPGEYRLHLFNPRTGKTETGVKKVGRRKTRLSLPVFKEDIAFRLLPLRRRPVVTLLEATPAGVAQGSPSRIVWQTDAAKAALDGKPVEVIGAEMVRPETTTVYELVVGDEKGGTARRQVQVTVVPAVPGQLELDREFLLLHAGAATALGAAVLNQDGDTCSEKIIWSATDGTLSDRGRNTVVFTAPRQAGACSITASAGTCSATATVRVLAAGQLALRVDCGGPGNDSLGWLPAELFARGAGSAFAWGEPPRAGNVNDPAPSSVYRTVLRDNHELNFADVPDGRYLVRIHFCDGLGGERLMKYVVEDSTVLEQFDVVKASGGKGLVVVREFEVTVDDGNGLQIECRKAEGNDVFEAGIEVLGRSGKSGTEEGVRTGNR